MTPRYTWGPDLGDVTFAADAPPAAEPAKIDVELVFKGVDAATGRILLEMQPYDPATHVQPDRLHAVLYPEGHGVHADPAAALEAGYPMASTHLAASPTGLDITLDRPAGVVAGAKYTGKTVLQFGLDDPPHTPAPAPTA